MGRIHAQITRPATAGAKCNSLPACAGGSGLERESACVVSRTFGRRQSIEALRRGERGASNRRSEGGGKRYVAGIQKEARSGTHSPDRGIEHSPGQNGSLRTVFYPTV